VNAAASRHTTSRRSRTMQIHVHYYAEVRELAGLSSEDVRLPSGSTTVDLVGRVLRLHPDLEEVREMTHVIVNGTMVTTSPVLHEGDTVALIPPVRGG